MRAVALFFVAIAIASCSVFLSNKTTLSSYLPSSASFLTEYAGRVADDDDDDDVEVVAFGGGGRTAASSTSSADGTETFEEMFEGSTNFLALLRQQYDEKISNPKPHCLQQIQNATHLRKQNVELRKFNRAIEVDFVGRDGLASVEPSWSSEESASCHFAALDFPPTKEVLEKALDQRTYVTAFHTAGQCREGFNWNPEPPLTCMGNNFGGTLGNGKSMDECIEESSHGYPAKLWLARNSNGTALECLNQFLIEEKFDRQFDLEAVRLSAGTMAPNVTALFDSTPFGVTFSFTKTGYGNNALDWNGIVFGEWARAVLVNSVIGAGTGNVSDNAVFMAVDHLLGMLMPAKESAGKTEPFVQCVKGLTPPIDNTNNDSAKHRIWKERGVHLKASKMAKIPSHLMKSFSGTLGGALPPPPTAVYSRNAILTHGASVPFEFYFPGCTAYWGAVAQEKKILKKMVGETNNNGSFGPLIKTPRVLHAEIIHACSKGPSLCPFPTFDVVIELTQVYCGSFFHFLVEIWPRIAPFLSGLLSDDMPKFAIRNGCDNGEYNTQFYKQFYELVGLTSPKIDLIGQNNVFAREVIIPTEGFSHSSLLNYWNLVPLRRYVRQHLGATDVVDSTIQQSNKTKYVLVIMRDGCGAKRVDLNIYDDGFLQGLSTGLGSGFNVTAYRSCDKVMMECLKCQVRAFMNADVIIGSHGAGLSHTLFAKPKAIVLERIVDVGNSGIYAELPFLLGMKYFPMADSAGWASYRDIILFADRY